MNKNKNMKIIKSMFVLTFIFCLSVASNLFAQNTEKFDIISYKAPKNWQKEVQSHAVQFGVENAVGGICVITLFKPLPGSANPKANFDSGWKAIVEETVSVKGKPVMQPSTNENGWTAESGFATYESDGRNGVAMLITMSGGNKMINIFVLTNTDAFQQNVSEFLESISLPKMEKSEIPQANNRIEQPQTAKNSGFKFTTTNFDDGWIATEQEDWVEVHKGSIKVLIHYPNKATDEYMPDGEADMRRAWDLLIAPRYRDASSMFMKYSVSQNSVDFVEADVTNRSTGIKVHVVMFRMQGSNKGRVLEFITPDKRTFEQEFGAFHEGTSGWEKVANMEYRNKFAVSPDDLNGRWTNDFSDSIQYVNAITGADVGMDTQASVQNFSFGAGNTYQWNIGVASGRVGSIKFDGAKSAGKFSVVGNWQVSFSNIEGKTRIYEASFKCVKGGRILMLDNRGFGKAK